jgi:hypothetical protein
LFRPAGPRLRPPEVQVIFAYDLSGVLVNGCNGEDIILLDGTFRTVIVTYADGSTKQRVTTQLKGTGTSGARYVINQTLRDNFDGTAYRGGSVAVLISQGPQVNETSPSVGTETSSLQSLPARASQPSSRSAAGGCFRTIPARGFFTCDSKAAEDSFPCPGYSR